jgi:hypothetical protein
MNSSLWHAEMSRSLQPWHLEHHGGLPIRELVERHRVRLSVYREFGPDEGWRQRPVGYGVELTGLVISQAPLADALAQLEAHRLLAHVASSAFRVLDGHPDLTFEIDGFRSGAILESDSWQVEVEQVSRILHRGDVRRAIDDSERRGLEVVLTQLRKLGVRE